MTASQAAGRNLSLDTLRGGAIVLVLIGHYLHFAPFEVAGRPLGFWVQDFGHGGVLLFFILSGYLIYSTAQNRDWPTFLGKRLAKIVPAYWVNVVFVFGAGLVTSVFPKFGLGDTIGNLLFLEGSLGIQPLSGVYWTLVVEVKFYVLFALVFFSPARPWLMFVPAACLLLNTAALLIAGRTSLLLTYLPAFFVGIGFARLHLHQDRAVTVAALLAVAVAGLVVGASHRGLPAAMFLAIDAALFWVVMQRRWAVPRLAVLGVVSYSVYLYHTTLGYPLLEQIPAFGLSMAWPLAAVAVLLLVLAVSLLSYRQIEVRFVEVANKWLPPRAPIAVAEARP